MASSRRIEDWSQVGQQAFLVLDAAREVRVDWSANSFTLDAADALVEDEINLFVLDASENEFAIDVSGPDARAGGDLYDESNDAILDEWGGAVIAA